MNKVISLSAHPKRTRVIHNKKLKAAFEYHRLGWSIIPMRESGKEKRPYIKWTKWQKQRPSPKQIKYWWSTKWPDANIGVVTGKVSGLVVLDFDSEDQFKTFKEENKLSDTATSKTNRGYHLYYQIPEGETVPSVALADKVELKAEGSIVILPPSVHIKSGEPYNWIFGDPTVHGLDNLKELPKNILKLCRDKQNSRGIHADSITQRVIEELNQKHAVIMVAGKCRVLNEFIDPNFHVPDIDFSSISDFRNWYSNKKVFANGKWTAITKVWLDSPDRREYQGLIFDPEKDRPEYYNLWRGFAVEPKKGDWSLFEHHIKEIISNGDSELAKWIFAWMARIVQDPGGERPGTTIVLRGGQGVGKGIFATLFGALFGKHFIHIGNKEQITGRFNFHLAYALVVFGDEVTWGGYKREINILRTLITEETVLCEPKFENAFKMKNRVNLILASNSEWVVPAGLDERRFCVLDVSESKKGDISYFKEMVNQMNNGGLEAMFYDLQKRDISGFDLRTIPKTPALLEQKELSMNSVGKFWLERLREGTTLSTQYDRSKYAMERRFVTDELITGYQEKWQRVVVTDILYADYSLFCKDNRAKDQTVKNHFVRKLRRICPGIVTGKKKTVEIEGVPYLVSKKKVNAIKIPPLDECRRYFEKAAGMKIPWEYE